MWSLNSLVSLLLRCYARINLSAVGGYVPGKHHDLVNLTKKFKGDSHEFFLNLNRWRRFNSVHALAWSKEKFNKSSKGKIPQERGLYIFTVELSTGLLPPHGYIMYAGITGDTSDNRDLRVRYGDYLRQLDKEDGRPAVYYMLKNWSKDLFFNYVALPDKKVDLAALEQSLLQAVIPPVNIRDLGAEVTAVKKAKF